MSTPEARPLVRLRALLVDAAGGAGGAGPAPAEVIDVRDVAPVEDPVPAGPGSGWGRVRRVW